MVSDESTRSEYQHCCPECVSCLDPCVEHCPECDAPRPCDGWLSIEESPYPFLGKWIDGRYLVDQFVDSGTSGHVYRARGRQFNQPVAVKVVDLRRFDEPLRTQLTERFYREVDLIAQLKNPHIIDVYEALELGEGVFGLVMSYVQGETLDALLERQGRFEVDEAVSLVIQIANGLHEAHRQGIVHRDVKPENVIVEQLPARGRFARVLDFGIALGDGVEEDLGFQGTPLYASPEQCTEETRPDARSDIYGLGCLFFHLLTGQPPFAYTNALRVMNAHVDAPRPRLNDACEEADFPVSLEHLIAHMLARNPGERPDDLGVVHRELSAFDRGRPLRRLGAPPAYVSEESSLAPAGLNDVTPPPEQFVSLGQMTSSELAEESTWTEQPRPPRFNPDVPVEMTLAQQYEVSGWTDTPSTVTACALDRRGLACVVADSSPAVYVVGLGNDPFETSFQPDEMISALQADVHHGVIAVADVRGQLLEFDPGSGRHLSRRSLARSVLAVETKLSNHRMVVGTEHGRVIVVDLRVDSRHEIMRFHQAVCALHQFGQRSLLVGLWDGSVAQISDGRLRWHLPVAPDAIADVGVLDDRRWFGLDAQGNLHVGELDGGNPTGEFDIGVGLRTVSLHGDRGLTGVSLFDGQLQAWHIDIQQ